MDNATAALMPGDANAHSAENTFGNAVRLHIALIVRRVRLGDTHLLPHVSELNGLITAGRNSGITYAFPLRLNDVAWLAEQLQRVIVEHKDRKRSFHAHAVILLLLRGTGVEEHFLPGDAKVPRR